VENLRKSNYKLFLYIVKISPYVIAFLYGLNTLLSYFCIDLTWMGYIAHLSLIPTLAMLAQSFVFKFCIYHRIPIYYIIANDAINSYDFFYGIPVSDKELLLINVLLSCFAIFCIILYYVKYHKKAIRKVAQ
jgi:hypothetical protein